MEKVKAPAQRKTVLLAVTWALALAIGVTVSQLEIFLLFAPLSAGIYLLTPGNT